MAHLSVRPEDVPEEKPAGLRLRTMAFSGWRLDAHPPAQWSWESFPDPRHRFDPEGARVRYASTTERGAFRERFHDERRELPVGIRATRVVRLAGRIAVLDLRDERVLDLVGLDDEVSVGRDRRVLRTCRLLMTRALGWYGERLHGVAYRSRTTPATSFNLAFTSNAPLEATAVGTLASRRALLVALIADDGFRTVGWDI